MHPIALPFRTEVGTALARQTLVLTRMPGTNSFLDALENVPAALQRDAPVAAPDTFRRYRRLSLRDACLGLAGYRDPVHPLHQAIARLKPGDPLEVRAGEDRWELLDDDGVAVGQLARGFTPPPGAGRVHAHVRAVVSWDRQSSEPEYQQSLRSEAWEVVVPELVFEPER